MSGYAGTQSLRVTRLLCWRDPAAPCDHADLMRLLFIGDIVGRPGRDLVHRGLPAIVDEHRIDLVIVNAENAAAGLGINAPKIGDQILDLTWT